MSGKKERALRKLAKQVAQSLPDRTYKARVGKYIHVGEPVPNQLPLATNAMVHHSVGEFMRNKVRVAKKYVKEYQAEAAQKQRKAK